MFFAEPTCVDLGPDTDNCGDCGTACPPGTYCDDGRCGCRFGDTLCPGAFGDARCVDVSRDADNCGECGTVCDPGTRCVAGRCEDDNTASPSSRPTPAAASEPATGPLSESAIGDLLPALADVPLGLALADEGTRGFEQIAGQFQDQDGGNIRPGEWDWRETAFRLFTERDSGSTGGGTHRLEATVHLFATERGASSALTNLAMLDGQAPDLDQLRAAVLGDQLLAFGGETRGGLEARVYARVGEVLIVVAATARVLAPFEDAYDVTQVVVDTARAR